MINNNNDYIIISIIMILPADVRARQGHYNYQYIDIIV